MGLLSAAGHIIQYPANEAATLEAEGLTIVLLGSFNPKIFQPEWFLRQELLHERDSNQAEIKTISSEFTEFTFDRIKVQVTPDRFLIDTVNLSRAEKVHDVVLGTFKVLCHTPLTACGINHVVHFQVDNQDYWHKIGHTLAPKELIWDHLFAKPGMQELTIQAPGDEPFFGEINIIVQPSAVVKPGVCVLANRSCNVPDDKKRTGLRLLPANLFKVSGKVRSLKVTGLPSKYLPAFPKMPLTKTLPIHAATYEGVEPHIPLAFAQTQGPAKLLGKVFSRFKGTIEQ